MKFYLNLNKNKNQYREKTTYQKMMESELWAEIEPQLAKKRQTIAGSKNLGLVMDSGTQLEKMGASRDIIAEKVGLGSGRTYERAKQMNCRKIAIAAPQI